MTETRIQLPTYADLMKRTDAPAGSAWGLFGPDDHIGTINLLSSDSAVRASSLVRRGKVFNLDYELNAFRPPLSPYRKELEHNVFARHEGHILDDSISNFFLQGSTQ